MNVRIPNSLEVVPFSLKEAPSFIENQFPIGRISAEVYKERKAIHGQALTGLGSYWKGRKPLLLVRASILGLLLPATKDPLTDLRLFLALLGMDDRSFLKRIKSVKPAQIDQDWSDYDELVDCRGKPRWREGLSKQARLAKVSQWLLSLPYAKRLAYCYRPDECPDDLHDGIWPDINAHFGTHATSLTQLIEQLGIMRYGHRPNIADTFAGGGSIPFEAARIGCHGAASDLNPIACMLTWGALNVIGGTQEQRSAIRAAQRLLAAAIGNEIAELGIERDSEGRKAKSYLYCVEVKCPKTGYLVPVAPSWVISYSQRVIAQLVEDAEHKRYDIRIVSNASDREIVAAESGTLVNDRVIHPANPSREGVAISVIRGDHKTETGAASNNLRRWSPTDVVSLEHDIFQERLYCIQWYSAAASTSHEYAASADDDSEDGGSGVSSTYFAAPTEHDLSCELKVLDLVKKGLSEWQTLGIIPNLPITPGEKTAEPIRTRGWTYWHHLFTPRHLLFGAIALRHIREVQDKEVRAALLIGFCRTLNYMSRMTQWLTRRKPPNAAGGFADVVNHVFYNQALNTFYNYGTRASTSLLTTLCKEFSSISVAGSGEIVNRPAAKISQSHDIYITDPPYADAVAYHEITEYFISWARAVGETAFPGFVWNSQRTLAIKGADELFRAEMVSAYRAMAEHMPDNGAQIVMFTHQDAGVWADLAAIMWSAGLRVTAAWNVVTETESATKKGNFVKGTILLVLRKRTAHLNIKRMDIEGEIEDSVDHQLAALNALDEDWTSERLYTDGDLQLAAYAAALRVITGYATIDRKEVGADVYRRLAKGEKTVIRELIEYAASVANNKLVPEGFPSSMWRDLDATSRFYVRMLDVENAGVTKFADFQDFARTFSVAEYADLMDSKKANAASLAGAGALKGKILGVKGFGSSPLRRVLFAIYKTMQKDDPREGLAFLKTELGQDYWVNRAKLVALAKYISVKTARTRPVESSAADLLAQRLEVDKV